MKISQWAGDTSLSYCKMWDLCLTISGDRSRQLDLRHNIKSSANNCEGCDRNKERQLLRVHLPRRLDGPGVQCSVVCGSFYSLDSDDWAVFQSRVRFVVQRKRRKPTHPTTESESGLGGKLPYEKIFFSWTLEFLSGKIPSAEGLLLNFLMFVSVFPSSNPLIIETKASVAIAKH